jgi:hypothetical protein
VEEFLTSLETELSSSHQPDPDLSNGSSIKEQELSSQLLIQTSQLTSEELEDKDGCKSGTPIPDGGNCSDMLVDHSTTLEPEKFLMFQVVEIEKVKALSSGEDTTE